MIVMVDDTQDSAHVTANVLSQEDREALLKAWPWPIEAATTRFGFGAVVTAVEQIVVARKADERERVARHCRAWANQRFDEHGPLDARGATLWDLAAWLQEADRG